MKTEHKLDSNADYHTMNLKTSHRKDCEDRRSEQSVSTRTRSQTHSDVNTSKMSRSCRSELDMRLMSERNREKLLDAFLPDIRHIHTRMGYTHRVSPFNLNRENLKTVQIRAKTAWYNQRELREHPNVTLGSGSKAANSVTPRPAWGYKALPINHMNDRLFPYDVQNYSAYVKRQRWDTDLRGSERPLPRKLLGKTTKNS